MPGFVIVFTVKFTQKQSRLKPMTLQTKRKGLRAIVFRNRITIITKVQVVWAASPRGPWKREVVKAVTNLQHANFITYTSFFFLTYRIIICISISSFLRPYILYIYLFGIGCIIRQKRRVKLHNGQWCHKNNTDIIFINAIRGNYARLRQQ